MLILDLQICHPPFCVKGGFCFALIDIRVPTSEGEGNCQTRARALRARNAWRKFTEIYGNPHARAMRAPCSYFVPPRGTVVGLKGQTRAQNMREQLPHILSPRMALKPHYVLEGVEIYRKRISACLGQCCIDQRSSLSHK